MKINYKEIRDYQYSSQININKSLGININDFKFSFYTFLKSRFYIEASVFLIFLSIKLNLKPNFLTSIYFVLGIIGGVFLSISYQSDYFLIIGVLIFFSKGIFDWSDGGLARITKRTSDFGIFFDSWSGKMGYISFVSGFSFYLFNFSNYYGFNSLIFIIFLIIFLICKSMEVNFINNENFINKNYKKKFKKLNRLDKLKKKFNLLKNLFDDRARSIDLICLLMIINLKYNVFLVLSIIFCFIVLKSIISLIYKLLKTINANS